MGTFSALLALCEGNLPVTSEFPSQRPVMWSFDVFFDLCLNKGLSKQLSRRRWFETPSRPLCSYSKNHRRGPHFFPFFVVVTYQSILPICFRVTSLALGQSYDCPSASNATLKNMGKYIPWIHWMETDDIVKTIQNCVLTVYSGTCIMRLGKSYYKHINFIICLARLYKIMFFFPVMKDHLSWETTKISGRFIQVPL